jgi:hypothetical protein
MNRLLKRGPSGFLFIPRACNLYKRALGPFRGIAGIALSNVLDEIFLDYHAPDAEHQSLTAAAAVLLPPAVGVRSRQRLVPLDGHTPGTTDSGCYRRLPDPSPLGLSIDHWFAPNVLPGS